MLTVGTHTAKILDYGISKTKDGLPQVLVNFGITNSEGHTNRISWYGSFKEKAARFTLKTLMEVMNMPCADPSHIPGLLSQIAEKGRESGLLDTDKEYSLVLEEQPDQNGKPRLRVRYVNNPGAGPLKFEKIAASEAKTLFGALVGVGAELKAEAPGIFKEQKDPFDVPF